METGIAYKSEFLDDGLVVEYEVCSTESVKVDKEIERLDCEYEALNTEIANCDAEIKRLTSHADGLDNMVAVTSGIICGLIDSFFVGEFSLTTEDGEWNSSKKVNAFVLKIAQSQGYQGNNLEEAIAFLENKYRIPSDPNLADFGGGKQHHLRDFAHHPTPIGLLFSLLTQFTAKCYGTNTAGAFIITPVKDMTLIGKTVPEKFFFGTVYWFFHMVSDMAGSHTAAGAGTGLPGPIVSLLKEIASLPVFQLFKNENGNSAFSAWISKLFNGTLLAKRDAQGKIIPGSVKNFDLRAELSFLGEITRQAVPIALNECIVRSFYFIRQFIKECGDKNTRSFSDLSLLNYENIFPFKNRTVTRMLSISISTFTVVDLTDAAIRSAASPLFWKDFVLHVNFVGIGRFAIAIGSEIRMGMNKRALESKRMELLLKQIDTQNLEISYWQNERWQKIEEADKAFEDCKRRILYAEKRFGDICLEINNDLDSILLRRQLKIAQG